MEDSDSSIAVDKKKTVRRKSSEIERNWKCDAPGCDKAYASKGSLKHHQKAKHTSTEAGSKRKVESGEEVGSSSIPSKKYKKDLLKVCDAEHVLNTELVTVRKLLNSHVKTLAHMVDMDWHDGYEEQGEEIEEYLNDVKGPTLGVCKLTCEHGVGFERCNEIMKVIADTWSNMNAVPMRGEIGDYACSTDFEMELNDTEVSIGSIDAVIDRVWSMLLSAAASQASVPDDVIYRMIKDAWDNGSSCSPKNPASCDKGLADIWGEGKDDDDDDDDEDKSFVCRGKARLARLVGNKSEWSHLPTTKKKHKMRRVIDRRFDGPKHLRTRDYSSGDDWW